MTHERSVTPYSSYFSYFLTVASVLIAALMVLAVLLVFFQTAQAQTYTVLYSFTGGTDGSRPIAGVVQDAMGNLYGTTSEGGVSDKGVVFKVDRAGNETVLYAFAGRADGATPTAGVLLEFAGSPYLLYGTTERGGAYDAGVVFRLSVANNETVLHTFTGGADGARPDAGLIRDAAGNFYGTASGGGVNGKGVVFKLDRAGAKQTVLHSFSGTDGDSPRAGLVRDAAGNLYGTTLYGGGAGNVFKLDPAGTETVLHNFSPTTEDNVDGFMPYAGLIRDAAGTFYGTAAFGYHWEYECYVYMGCGIVFKLDAAGNYTPFPACGINPIGGLVRDASGNLYGTTQFGGSNGNVFKLDPAGNCTALHYFNGYDGALPYGTLIMDSKGSLYGATAFGGAYGYGAVFKITFP